MSRYARFIYFEFGQLLAFVIIGSLVVVRDWNRTALGFDATKSAIWLTVLAFFVAFLAAIYAVRQVQISVDMLIEARRQTFILIHGKDATMPNEEHLLSQGHAPAKRRALGLTDYICLFWWTPNDE